MMLVSIENGLARALLLWSRQAEFLLVGPTGLSLRPCTSLMLDQQLTEDRLQVGVHLGMRAYKANARY